MSIDIETHYSICIPFSQLWKYKSRLDADFMLFKILKYENKKVVLDETKYILQDSEIYTCINLQFKPFKIRKAGQESNLRIVSKCYDVLISPTNCRKYNMAF